MLSERKSLADDSSDDHSSIGSADAFACPTMEKPSFRLPSVPKQAGLFIRQLVKEVFSMSKTRSTDRLVFNPIRKRTLGSLIETKAKRVGPLLKTQILSEESNLFVNVASKDRQRRRTKLTTNNNNSRECGACRRLRTIDQPSTLKPTKKTHSEPKR